jgi:peroxiredoxin Q/BCP
MSFLGLFSHREPLKPGEPAPRIAGVDQEGAAVDFAAAYSRGLVLVYFYPKASTPGCTAQACSLRDAFADLTGEGLEIFGVSRDTPGSQKKFREKFRLPFTLVADADGGVAAAFGVSTVLGFAKRQSFLIREGRVAWTSLQAKTADHAKEVQDAIAGLA